MTTVLDHAQALIRCPSVTPHEGGAIRYLETVLAREGFSCHKLVFEEPGTASVENLFAVIGSGSPHICFAGHTDVVPPGDDAAWRSPPFGAEIKNGVLYGRGACDMKGGVAAMLTATMNVLRDFRGAVPGTLSFLITGDEEGPAINGTAKVVDWLRAKGIVPDCCVLPECTSEAALGDTIKIGRRGSLNVTITMTGLQGHVAYPHKSKNPLPHLLNALQLLLLKPIDEGNEHFQPSNLEITSIDTGNPTFNIIPAQVKARFNIRFNNLHTSESLQQWIDTQIAAALSETGIAYKIDYDAAAESFLTTPGQFVQRLRAAVIAEAGIEPALSTGGGTSDARFIKNLCPVAELGMPNKTAHKVDECVAVADLETLARIFTRFLHLSFASA